MGKHSPFSCLDGRLKTMKNFGTRVLTCGGMLAKGIVSGIGYAKGAGSTVIQITSRTTGVTINALCGTIQTDTSSLGSELSADMIVTNSKIAIGDVVVVSIQSGSNSTNTAVTVTTVTATTFTIKVSNNTAAGGTAETGAIIINFAIIKAVAS